MYEEEQKYWRENAEEFKKYVNPLFFNSRCDASWNDADDTD